MEIRLSDQRGEVRHERGQRQRGKPKGAGPLKRRKIGARCKSRYDVDEKVSDVKMKVLEKTDCGR